VVEIGGHNRALFFKAHHSSSYRFRTPKWTLQAPLFIGVIDPELAVAFVRAPYHPEMNLLQKDRLIQANSHGQGGQDEKWIFIN
jgi:hypothetical protein